MIDLRSDTVTRPTEAMRRAMAEAEVGDDVYGEDPTINLLEQRAAATFGKEAALFVPTGTMGNTIGLKVHTNHGEEVLCEARSHIVDWELSMMAWFAGCIPRMVPTDDGILRWDRIKDVIRRKGPHNAPTTLISLENSHNMAGGTVYPTAVIDEICGEAHARGLKVHIDGARIFNAAARTGEPVSRMTREADSVMFSLSKGLGAPVGSLLVANAEVIDRGRLLRKRLGGGMRQAGVLASAGLIALETGPNGLAEDQENAQRIGRRLNSMDFITVSPVATNIVIFDIARLGCGTKHFSSELKQRGVLANGISDTQMRMVTHRDVSATDCECALDITEEVIRVCQNAHDALPSVL